MCLGRIAYRGVTRRGLVAVDRVEGARNKIGSFIGWAKILQKIQQ